MIAVVGLLLGLLPISANPQIIENPAKPPAANAGRVVTVREEMRIEDTGKDFTFTSVWDIKVAADGTIFVKDGNQQVLQFDPGGKFIRNLMKKGQGPGELNSVDSIFLAERRSLLQGIPPKILAFDFHGKLLEETNLASAGGRIRLLVGAGPTDFYLSRRGLFDPGQGTGWIDFPEEIVEISPKNNSVKVVGVFPIKSYIKVTSSGRGGVAGGMMFHSLIIVPFGESKFVVNSTPEYEVTIFDAARIEVILRFRRVYERVVRKNAGRAFGSINGQPGPEIPKYRSDIAALNVVDGRLWIQTSTVDAKKGVLFDIFDAEGRYVDCFYLKYSKKDIDPDSFKRFFFANGFVYFSDTTEDEFIVIKKGALVGLK